MNIVVPVKAGNDITAQVVRSNRRKTAEVRVENGIVSIVVPVDLPQDRIEQILNKKSKWIRHKIVLHHRSMPVQPKEYVSGESVSYLGKNYRLKVIKAPEPSVKLIDGRMQVTLPQGMKSPHAVKEALVGWYKEHAQANIRSRVERYAPIVGVQPNNIEVRSFKARWGSCHLSGDIQYNWKIIIAPNRIVDYVVVHELCHLKQHDHSPKFWKLVGQIIPDYLECKDWLRVNGRSLQI